MFWSLFFLSVMSQNIRIWVNVFLSVGKHGLVLRFKVYQEEVDIRVRSQNNTMHLGYLKGALYWRKHRVEFLLKEICNGFKTHNEDIE